MNLERVHAETVALLNDLRDVILGRLDGAYVTNGGWATTRGWRDYLLGLSDRDLDQADTSGIPAWFVSDRNSPSSLRALAERTAWLTSQIVPAATHSPALNLPSTNLRKRGQLAAILRLLREEFAQVSEIVDVGAGRGQLTAQAAVALDVPAFGLERNPERVAAASALAGDCPVRFLNCDVLSPEDPLMVLPENPTRLFLALHGCGQLGDALVRAAAKARAAVLMLGCCPQKICSSERVALVAGGPAFPKEVLGLANVYARARGVEGDLRHALAGKESRLALRYLFAARGETIAAGEEMRGVNRRKANAGVTEFAAAVCRARGLSVPTPAEIAQAAAMARAHYQAQRRLSLPRSMLGRPLEIFIALDRTLYLRAHGVDARVVELFPPAISPRNLAIVGRRM